MATSKRVIIIGGGVIGLSLAYHLARRGERDILVLERNQMTAGTTWHAAGIVGPLRSTFNMTKLAMRAMTLFPELEEETGLSTGYQQTTGYWLARREERMDELHRIRALADHVGMHPEIVSGDEVARRVPGISPDGITGALTLKEDGQVNPVDLCMAYARAARAMGVEIREGVKVDRIIVEDGAAKGVTLYNGEEIAAEQVALCGGAWSKKLAEDAGTVLPLQAVQHMYVVTEPMAGMPNPYPIFRDMEKHIYMKGDAGKLLVGWFEMDAIPWDPYSIEGDRPFLEMAENWDQAEPFITAAMELVPQLEQTGIQYFLNGPESFTHDSKPLVGETPEVDGLFVATGMNSVGVMSSAGIGHALADWMVEQEPTMDLWEVDIRRCDSRMGDEAFMTDRMREVVGNNFAMHWPYKQPISGRDLRHSPLHEPLAKAGAVFGMGGAWERTLWFAETEAEKSQPYSVGEQHWQKLADREAGHLATDAALIDLSPFTKIDVSGPDALALLQKLSSGNMDTALGRATYSCFLNDRGGIEADLTVTRMSEDAFRVTSGAATRRKDLAWIQRQGKGMDVRIADVTEAEAVIGLMGPRSRSLLEGLSRDDWWDFPFGTARSVTVADCEAVATRVSFVGELGWELSVAADQAEQLFDALNGQGVKQLGTYALDGCRIEKAFRHWGHDLGPEITPLEAGLAFTVDWSKADFIGRAALARQKADGIKRRLVLLRLEDKPLCLHDEPVWEGDKVVGLTTSGARGPRTGLQLAFAMVEIAPGESLSDTAARSFRVQVADRFHDAAVLARPPYDPAGERMKA